VEIVIGTLSGVPPETKIRPSNEPGKSEESFKVTSIMFLPLEKLALRTGVPLNPIFLESRFFPVKSSWTAYQLIEMFAAQEKKRVPLY
jgi:hypothetical protein